MDFHELFYKDPYLREFDAEVLACTETKKGYEIVLSDTAFYPEGGGQPADHGTLTAVNGGGETVTAHVADVQRRKDDTIVHYADKAFTAGTTVHGAIDWARRFDHMQNHSGEHIVSGLVHRHYGYENVGYHMGEDVITIDLSGVLTWEQLMEIEREANDAVYRNLPIEVTYPTGEELGGIDYRSKKELKGQVRIVTVPGVDVCACCGTHTARTGEIGVIKCFSMIHYKGGVRIEMASGMKALRHFEAETDRTLELMKMLAAKPDKILTAVEKVQKESQAKDFRIFGVLQKYFAARAAALPDEAPHLVIFEEGLTPVETRKFCEYLLEAGKGTVCGVLNRQEDRFYYVIGSRTVDVRPLGKTLNAALQGRGGGTAEMIQGTFGTADEEAVRAAIEEAAGGVLRDV